MKKPAPRTNATKSAKNPAEKSAKPLNPAKSEASAKGTKPVKTVKTAKTAKTVKTAKTAMPAKAADDAAADNAPDVSRAAKRALRAEVRAAIRALSRFKRERKSRSVADFALRAPAFGGRGLLLAYRALPDEACVDAAIAALAARGWRVAVPTVDARGAMQLVELRTDTGMPDVFDSTRWTLDAHAIRAPRVEPQHTRRVRAREVDAVLVPGRAFDRLGNRLGRGQGHYDKLLAALRPDARAATVGVGFAEQVVESVPVDPHDRPVAWLVTDRGITRCHRAGRGAAAARG
jgi:5-formyltetrahydrofolate cyclo-ligase